MPYTPEKPFGDPVTPIKPNIPDCWESQPVTQKEAK